MSGKGSEDGGKRGGDGGKGGKSGKGGGGADRAQKTGRPHPHGTFRPEFIFDWGCATPLFTAAYLPKSCFTSAAFQRALPPKRVTSLTVARSRLLAQQLFYFGGLRKIVAAEASVHRIPPAKRRTDYLPSNCFTSAATVTPL